MIYKIAEFEILNQRRNLEVCSSNLEFWTVACKVDLCPKHQNLRFLSKTGGFQNFKNFSAFELTKPRGFSPNLEFSFNYESFEKSR